MLFGIGFFNSSTWVLRNIVENQNLKTKQVCAAILQSDCF
jgi:hypothetical protein